MAENITLASISNAQQITSAATAINNNNTLIENAFTDVLSLSGVTPNQMLSNLDMNSNQIINLPAPVGANSPARLVDVVSNPTLVLTIPPVGTSGATVPLLNANNTFSGNNTHSGSENFTSTFKVSGTTETFPTSGILVGTTDTQTLTNKTLTSPVLNNGGVLTLPTSTDTLVGRATTDTLTNKTLTSPTITGTLTANNTVTNAALAQAAANTIKGNNTSGTANVVDITVPQAQAFLNINQIAIVTTGVNFNSANTDTSITIPTLPTGFTQYRVVGLFITNASHTIITANCGLFSLAGGGGSAIVSGGTACTNTNNTANTALNFQSFTINTLTTCYNLSTLFFRVATAEGAAATATVTVVIQPVS